MKKLIILAAGEGSRLRPYTLNKPKCMVEVKGRSILDWQILVAREMGINEVFVVKGYLADKIDRPDVKYFLNKEYDSTNMVETLWRAHSEFNDEVIISYGDILYEPEVLQAILDSDKPISVIVDKGWRKYWEKRFDDPLSDAESLIVDEEGKIKNIGQKVTKLEEIQGQYIGLIKFGGNGIDVLKKFYGIMQEESFDGFGCGRPVKKLYMTDLLQGIIDSGYEIHEVPIQRRWLEIDSTSDYKIADELTLVIDGTLRVQS